MTEASDFRGSLPVFRHSKRRIGMKIRYHHPMFYTDTYEDYDNVCKEFFAKVMKGRCGD